MSRGLVLPTPQSTSGGTPFPAQYNNVYHSSEDGLTQARHVSLGGDGLPGVQQGKRTFTIVETDFGQGLNFLATWAAWRRDPQRYARLDFVSIEEHPFNHVGLSIVHPKDGALAPLAEILRQSQSAPMPGVHRLTFDGDYVILTLLFDDVMETLPQPSYAIDASYLDGFSPAKSPDLWQPRVFKQLARVARIDATLTTYITAGFVRHGSQEAGFEVREAPSFGTKCGMTVTQFPARWRTRRGPAGVPVQSQHHAIVLDTGLADCAVAERLVSRDRRITLIDKDGDPVRGASAHHATAIHPHVSIDGNVLSQLSHVGNFLARRHWSALDRAGFATGFQCTGVLQLAEHTGNATERQRIVQALGYPTDYIDWLNIEQTVEHIGANVPQEGWWFAQVDWVALPDICRANLTTAGAAADARWNTHVESLHQGGDQWAALDAHQNVIARTLVIVLANSLGMAHLALLTSTSLKSICSQLTDVSVTALQADVAWPEAVVCGEGCLSPAEQGAQSVRIGPSFQPDASDLTKRVADHVANLRRLTALQPG